MLESAIVDQIVMYLEKNGIRYGREIHMGIGVPDIAINIGARSSMSCITDYYILSMCEYIGNYHPTKDEINMKYHFNDKRLHGYIDSLLQNGIIEKRGDRFYLKRTIESTKLGKTISIEVKLKDWRNGLLQASRYLGFSDYSYLALPQKAIRNVNQSSLVELGIGLLSVDENGIIEEIIHPASSAICDYKQKYIVTSAILSSHAVTKKRRNDPIFGIL